jgi:hypothetical protein
MTRPAFASDCTSASDELARNVQAHARPAVRERSLTILLGTGGPRVGFEGQNDPDCEENDFSRQQGGGILLSALLGRANRISQTLVAPIPQSLRWPPNQRMKLSARGGRLVGSWSFLSAAAAGRSLSAIR